MIVLTLGILIGLGVCAPVLGGGRVLLLDWSIGSHLAVVTPAVLGLNGGLTAGIGGSLGVAILSRVLGGAVTWVPILAFFPVAMVGAGRLAGRTAWSRIAAGTLYAVNPFVFNRVYVGHLPLLVGYALLPFAVASALRAPSSPIYRWPVTALWWAALTSLSPHFVWIFGVVVISVTVISIIKRRSAILRTATWFAATVGALALMSVYIMLPASATTLPTRVGSVSLAIYRTTGDPHLGLFANVLSLYGFWRTGPGPQLPKDVVIGWPFLMIAILLIVAMGVWRSFASDDSGSKSSVIDFPAHETAASPSVAALDSSDHGRGRGSRSDGGSIAAPVLLFAGVAGFFLALGNQGPTGGLFLWAYDHVPFFSVMREPQKFLMLLALAYSIFFGWGVEEFTRIDLHPKRLGTIAATVLVGIALPLGYTATIFGGLAGQISASAVPGGYARANNLMGDGAGNILYLPWHLYMEYPFTDGRVVANLGPTSFSRNVISGDDVQVDDVETQSTSPRSLYLQRLYAEGPNLAKFGALVAPLGVQYVVLAKTVDWANYNWLGHQRDLKLVLDDASLEVWRNESYQGVGQTVHVRSGTATSSHLHTSFRLVHELSPVAYQVGPGRPGWVNVDAAYQKGWSFNGREAIKSPQGTLLVRVGADGGQVKFTPWGLVRLGYLVSAGAFAILLAVLLVRPRRRTARSQSR